MKKSLVYFTALVLFLSLCICLFSCGNDNTESSSSQSDVPTSSQADKDQDSATGNSPSSTQDGSEQNPSTDDEQSSTPSSEQGSASENNQSQSSTQDSTTVPSGSDENGEQNPEDNLPSLEFTLSKDNSYYIVTGIGSCLSYFLDIPEEYEGKPVKEIAEGAFLENGNVYVVTIPKSVEAIHANAFCNDISVLFMHSYPLEGFIDGWIQNTNNCYWYSEEMPLIEDFYNDSYNYWHEPELPQYWGVFTDEYILNDTNKENMISVYTQYAAEHLNKTVTDNYFDFKYEKIFIGTDALYFTSPESSLEEFGELKVGDHWSDVLKLDPFLGNYKWLFASYTKFPKYSEHFFMQAYYKIDYDDNYIITKIEKILPETN